MPDISPSLASSIAESQDRITKLLRDGSSGFGDINDALSAVSTGKQSYGEAYNQAKAQRINDEMGLYKTLSTIQQTERANADREQLRRDTERRHQEDMTLRRDLANKPIGPSSTIGKLRADLAAGRITQADFDKAAKGDGGPFAGTSMDAQATNILLNGNPGSPEYAAAYRHLATARTQPDGTIIQPDMSPFRRPSGAAAADQAPIGTPGVPTVTRPQITPKQRDDLNSALTEAAGIVNSLQDYRQERKSASTWDKTKSIAGLNTPLNTSFNVAALLAKGEQLFKLGVLNGPDLDIIRRTLPDPSTVKGAAVSDEDAEKAINKVLNIIQDGISAKHKQLGLDPVDIKAYGASLRPQGAMPQELDYDPATKTFVPRGK